MKELIGNNTFPATVPAPQNAVDPINEATFDPIIQALADRTEWLKLNKEAAFPAGTKMLFMQASAPLGWALDVTANHAAGLRIVTDATGGQAGGSSDAFASHAHTIPAHGHANTFSVQAHWLTTAELTIHRHQIWDSNVAGDGAVAQLYGEGGNADNGGRANTYYAGNGQGHQHNLGGSVTDAGAMTSGYFSPKFQNAIICVKA